MKLLARKSGHIQNDLARNWSSWNFGQEGLFCTADELEAGIQNCLENDMPLYISGMELWGDELRSADIRELYEGYYVLVDNVNAGHGLSFVELSSDNLDDARVEIESAYFAGDGVCFSADEVELIESVDDIHIFFVK
ncbi:MAG: hypothetical protein KIT33_15675 [Candidatus Kapabacteria bacterium]|nr:hypothetical protein [Ignavibacteriota bacterium]MBX3045296.1 hypothetical protein [Ignavibacteriota bacterium]MCW5885788.1 hypothetical protein [Candidatus Kapabacteria bacterium]MCW5886410.1 hypothetical protein [Candidatus Kapabacteria bacterium]